MDWSRGDVSGEFRGIPSSECGSHLSRLMASGDVLSEQSPPGIGEEALLIAGKSGDEAGWRRNVGARAGLTGRGRTGPR